MNAPSATSSLKRRRRAARQPETPAIAFPAFIAYGDFAAMRRATATINDVLRRARERFDFRPMVWRFDQLANVRWQAQALQDARTAAVIVLATSSAGPLPPAVEAWINALFAQRPALSTTIVALLGEHDAWTISVEPPAVGEETVAECPDPKSAERVLFRAA